MGITWHDGYSTTIESYLVVDESRYRIAKTNAQNITLSEDCELAPGTVAEMRITIDGDTRSKLVRLPDGVPRGCRQFAYQVEAPF